MYGYFFIIVSFFLSFYISEQNNACKVLKDEPFEGTHVEKLVHKLEIDEQNVTNHLNQYISKLRDTIKNEESPPGTVKYYLFTSVRKEPFSITRTKGFFRKTPYNNGKPLAFLIHGYDATVKLDRGSWGDLIQSVVNLNTYNVIAVYYAQLNKKLASVVVPEVFLAAKDMAQFLHYFMDETGTKREHIHLIGLSLGGQIAGMIGQIIPGLGRITALDPGGGFFIHFPKDLRLDRSDANFVDVIHNCDGYPFLKGLGFYPPCGHLDFYPNGGLFQPGCNSTEVAKEPKTKEEMTAKICMHNRVILYFTESTCGNCSFKGTLCDSYENYQKGLCTPRNSMTAVMGEFASKPSVDLPENSMFFLDTNGQYPFCKHN